MTKPDSEKQPEPTDPPDGVQPRPRPVGKLRGTIPWWQQILFGALCIVCVLGVWFFLTLEWTPGEKESRILSAAQLPSPSETVAEIPALFNKRNVDWNTLISLRRVLLGFGLATVVGVPLGVLAGCFPRVSAFLQPLSLFGRNAPMAAVIPLTIALIPNNIELLGNDEAEKVFFIFVATVAFILADTSRAVSEVAERYVDTAYTLGASRWQTVMKVLVPLAMPHVFNSLRLLFGLAFGYIMLVEVIVTDADYGGVGAIINVARRRGPIANIYLILLIIPIVAFFIDRFLYFLQTQLFPYRYGGAGYLSNVWNTLSYTMKSTWEGGNAADKHFRAKLEELTANVKSDDNKAAE